MKDQRGHWTNPNLCMYLSIVDAFGITGTALTKNRKQLSTCILSTFFTLSAGYIVKTNSVHSFQN